MQIISIISQKIEKLHYLNRSVIFFSDMIISVLGTVISYILVMFTASRVMYNDDILLFIIYSAIFSFILFLLTGQYKNIIRHSTVRELPRIFLLMIIKVGLLFVVISIYGILSLKLIAICALLDMLISTFAMISSRAFIVNIYYAIININKGITGNAFIYGTENRSSIIVREMNYDFDFPYRIKGYLTRSSRELGIKIAGKKVFFVSDDRVKLQKRFKKSAIEYLFFASKEDFNTERNDLVEFCIENHIKMMVLGELKNLENNNLVGDVKQIEVEDLLQREEIKVDIEKISFQMNDKVVLVTGAAGSIGSEVVRQVVKFNIKKIILFDNAETPLHLLKLELESKCPNIDVLYFLGDVRSKDRVKELFSKYGVNFVFHAAAYKHVPMIEMNPCESILANVWGSINVAHYAAKYNVDKFIMISTDKAVNPTSVMGASKRIAEICVQSLNNKNIHTQFIVTRFGNVLGSNGSVIPLFKDQIAKGGPITVTHPDMVRYFMTIPEACRLVLQASVMGKGGEIYLFDMGEQVNISKLAHRMISLSGFIPNKDIKIEYVGLRPGEKLYEELLTCSESTSATKHEKIRVAHIDEINIEIFNLMARKLIVAARRNDVSSTIIIMKQIVPEYISNNSEFQVFDNKQSTLK